ncbi:hypothetical protein [uncultured Brevundimonas sp.]|uniref:hypothetical protein n=1 Tax=uncultured Brevundimonas sp. TaxID=213418 RepID=UPI0030ED56DA|tara:strand:+ start:52915 stop:53427 length:513 start_codon:yes stop_codon:yes gene_type:complete
MTIVGAAPMKAAADRPASNELLSNSDFVFLIFPSATPNASVRKILCERRLIRFTGRIATILLNSLAPSTILTELCSIFATAGLIMSGGFSVKQVKCSVKRSITIRYTASVTQNYLKGTSLADVMSPIAPSGLTSGKAVVDIVTLWYFRWRWCGVGTGPGSEVRIPKVAET